MPEGQGDQGQGITALNQLDRFHLALEAIERVPGLKEKAGHVIEDLNEHHRYVREYGEDMPDITGWKWQQ
jgi:xylulose-5-phosphate/fructose-6-phosphate phosphoketolase